MSQQYRPTISHLKNPPGRDMMVDRSDMIGNEAGSKKIVIRVFW
ncbi:hypothetical protein [Microcoleus sp. AR_TQ3_B6]